MKKSNENQEQHLKTIEEKSAEQIDNEMQVSRCLLANDDLFLLEAFKETLSKHFQFVDTVTNGQSAVQQYLS